jgi:quercetin dioxygenase-like cupin family protein
MLLSFELLTTGPGWSESIERDPSMTEVLRNIPAEEGVRRVGAGEGEKFDIAGAHLTWKVKSLDSAYQFSVCEMTLAPGEGVPVHSHSSAESFYVLTGTVDFYRINDGKEDWLHCEAGDLMILPPNSLHGFQNRGLSLCRLLGISTAAHQAFFDSVVDADREARFASMPHSRAMEKIAQIAQKHHMYIAPIGVGETDAGN